MTIRKQEQEFINDFNELNDWFLQYEYLIELTCGMHELEAEKRTEQTRVAGCQSGVWLGLENTGGVISVKAYSEALIIKGMLAVIVSLLSGRSAQEIMAYEMRFVDETPLREQMSTDRFKGMSAVVDTIKAFAKQCIKKG